MYIGLLRCLTLIIDLYDSLRRWSDAVKLTLVEVEYRLLSLLLGILGTSSLRVSPVHVEAGADEAWFLWGRLRDAVKVLGILSRRTLGQ